MLRMQIIGLALVSAAAMGVVAVSSASAETELHQWLVAGKLLASPVKVHALGLVLLADDSSPVGGPVVVHCKGFGDGTVGPHGLSLALAITTELLKGSDLIPCNFDKAGGCKENVIPRALALNLPWRGELVLVGGRVRNLVLADGNGAPGWRVVCTNILGGESKDSCLAEGGVASAALANVTEGVEARSDSESGSAECSLNGEAFRHGAGLVRGSGLAENVSSTEKLTVAFA